MEDEAQSISNMQLKFLRADIWFSHDLGINYATPQNLIDIQILVTR